MHEIGFEERCLNSVRPRDQTHEPMIKIACDEKLVEVMRMADYD